ncbi:MAG: hypothetical protein KJ592_01250 [Nanoarchaeota archaeon]|nr:hypothetical protein [Nanoarchaeota archaeon]
MINKKAQQEIVGFVLIVVLVVIGLMVFLVISLRGSDVIESSSKVTNILDAVMKHTTECAIVYEPDYADFEELFKSCNSGDRCKNLGVDACDYLNESLRDVLWSMMASEASIDAYQLDFFVKDGTPPQVPSVDGKRLLQIVEGNCTGSISSAQRSIVFSRDSDLIVRMKICGV